MPSNDDYYDPCETCFQRDSCDSWEAQFYCQRCKALGLEHCNDCDPWDI